MSPFLIISIGIVAAAVFGVIARAFKQPPVVGYLFGGLVLGLFQIVSGQHVSDLAVLGQLGVTFLLFLIGLEMDFKELKIIGRVVAIGGVGQIIFTTMLAYFLSILLGYSPIESLYIGIALTFSSTIIIVKLLSEKKDLESLYGKIAIGFLLVQDIVAILALVFLSGFQFGQISLYSFAFVFIKGVLLLGIVWLLSKFVLTKIFDKISSASNELLFVGSVAWVLLVASIVSLKQVGFTPEIGGLLAGIALANSTSHLQIAARVRPLRDFFITIFFLLLGVNMAYGLTPHVILPALVLSLFVIFVGPVVVLSLLGLLGHKKRTSFLVAVAFAQVSEFSLVLVTLGHKIGHLSSEVVSVVTLVAVITMVFSTYLIMNGYNLYQSLSKLLSIFEKKNVLEKKLFEKEVFENHLILVGCHRLGKRVLPTLLKRKENLIVLDFNPVVIKELLEKGIQALLGDISDNEIQEVLNLPKAKIVISTTGSVEDNLFLLESVAKLDTPPLMVFSASNTQDALILYQKGADYVIVPQVAGGDHLAHLISTHGLRRDYYTKLKERQISRMTNI